MHNHPTASLQLPCSKACRRAAAPAAALLLALACADASALVRVSVHADFPTGGFGAGPVYGSTGPQSFDVWFDVDETAAVHHAAGFEVRPGAVVLGHDVYSIGYDAIKAAGSFSFGTQSYDGMALHNLSFALLFGGVLAAPMFITDLQVGATPLIEVAVAPSADLGSYDFSPFVPGTLQTAFLTNGAQVWDGHASAFGTVSVQVSAVPEPTSAGLLVAGLAAVMAWRRGQRAGPAQVS